MPLESRERSVGVTYGGLTQPFKAVIHMLPQTLLLLLFARRHVLVGVVSAAKYPLPRQSVSIYTSSAPTGLKEGKNYDAMQFMENTHPAQVSAALWERDRGLVIAL